MIEYVFVYVDCVGNRFKMIYHSRKKAKSSWKFYKGLMVVKSISPKIKKVRRDMTNLRERIVNMTYGSVVYIEDLPS